MEYPRMSLGRFATVVGASPRWVQNAFQVLNLPALYDEEGAKTLGLARLLQESFGVQLVVAYPLAAEALAARPDVLVWRKEHPSGAVAMEVDLERYLSGYAARLALARHRYLERQRGRPRAREKKGIEGAVEHGVDVGLLEASLERTPEERLRRLDEDVEFLRSLRVEEP
jgi:hypothetical protein